MLQEISSSRKETVNFEILFHSLHPPPKKRDFLLREGIFYLAADQGQCGQGLSVPKVTPEQRGDQKEREPFHIYHVTPSDKQHQTAYQMREEERWQSKLVC